MQLSSNSHIPDGLLAANVLLREKPHQGVPSWNLALHQGIDERNSTAAIGLRAGQHLNRIWSRYTGKERDQESKNDYFFARYYNSAIGRFTTPDWSAKVVPVPYAVIGDPQSLNLYAYVRNNPIVGVDPDGHDGCAKTDALCIGLNAGWDALHGITNDKTHISLDTLANGLKDAQQQSASGNAAEKPGRFSFDPTLPAYAKPLGKTGSVDGPAEPWMAMPAGTMVQGNKFEYQVVGLSGLSSDGQFTVSETIRTIVTNTGPDVLTNRTAPGGHFGDFIGFVSDQHGSFQPGLVYNQQMQTFSVTLPNGIVYGLSTVIQQSSWMLNGIMMGASPTVIRQ